MEHDNINRNLNLMAWGIATLAVAILCFGEAHCLPLGIIPQSFSLQALECLLTLLCVPLALKLMATKHAKARLKTHPKAYAPLSALRLALLALPLLLGLLLYYLMMDTSMLYCALIAALAHVYVWPTKRRQAHETGQDTPE